MSSDSSVFYFILFSFYCKYFNTVHPDIRNCENKLRTTDKKSNDNVAENRTAVWQKVLSLAAHGHLNWGSPALVCRAYSCTSV